MATLAALLKSRGHIVQGSDQNVYPPMSDFLVEQGIKTFSGYSPDHITPDIDLVVVGKRDLARKRRARIGPGAQGSLLLAA